MTITREQFDALKVGDELKNETLPLIIEAKFVNTIIAIDNDDFATVYSFRELQEAKYSIIHPVQHNCGFPYGDYSDKEVVVKVSDYSIDDCKEMGTYARLMSVSNSGFKDHNNLSWKYATLITNNVELVK